MRFNYYQLACDLWGVLLLIWLLGSISNKPIARAQSRGSRMLQSAFTFLGLLFIFDRKFHHGWLGATLLTPSDLTGWIGLLLTLLGILFAIWARATLGRNWSGTVTLKEDHTLIRRGPYRIVRHPIYTGFLLAAFGVAIIVGEARGLVGMAILFFGLWFKSTTEESFMLANFGEQYVAYKREVKALIPFVF